MEGDFELTVLAGQVIAVHRDRFRVLRLASNQAAHAEAEILESRRLVQQGIDADVVEVLASAESVQSMSQMMVLPVVHLETILQSMSQGALHRCPPRPALEEADLLQVYH